MTGQVIKEIIKKKGFKQNYIASEVGLHPVTLNKYLNGKTEIKDTKIYRLCELLEVEFILEKNAKKN
ncbi:helix-turn-helix transcriptional regulator [Bacillus sp. ISL-7]|uniref:helix-turn-helix domain-containing protein n=1 Tax=Bacillus sp. ISL-7 TaxID=2819136 RepID=UPI001BE698B4|nr:helix-turn-helix transcriptional regulator [Bacillus sp. ISL-7]MBT2736144.1 helix-turn-helix transcriptional regulator [Bacillus sp. ISL-7]